MTLQCINVCVLASCPMIFKKINTVYSSIKGMEVKGSNTQVKVLNLTYDIRIETEIFTKKIGFIRHHVTCNSAEISETQNK